MMEVEHFNQKYINPSEMIRDLIKIGFNQTQIGSELGICPSSVSKILSGRQRSVKYRLAVKIRQIYIQHCHQKIYQHYDLEN